MAYRKWTDEENANLLNAANAGTSVETLAAIYMCTAANINWRVSMLRKAAKNAKKPSEDYCEVDETTISEPVKVETVDPDSTSAVGETVQGEPVSEVARKANHGKTGDRRKVCEQCLFLEDDTYSPQCGSCDSHYSNLLKAEKLEPPINPIPAVNQQIANLCELPEPPKPKPDYTESLLETLREAIEFRETVYFCEPLQAEPKPIPQVKPQPYTPFVYNPLVKQAHSALNRIIALANQSDIKVSNIELSISAEKFMAEASDGNERVELSKKNQPVSGNSTD